MTAIHNDDGTITLERQQGCARCGATLHDDMVYKPLTHPIVVAGVELTHWSMCPATDEPILMTVERDREEASDGAEAEAAPAES